MGRNITAATSVTVSDIKKLRVNQASGVVNVQSVGTSNWTNWDSYWSGQYSGSNNSITISSATSYLKITVQANNDHGDTWRSGVNAYGIYTNRNASSGPNTYLGTCAVSNFISGYSTSGSNGFSQCLIRPADYISGLQDGDSVHFVFVFRKQDGGGWYYLNNMHTNTESNSNGVMSKAGMKFDIEEVPLSIAGADWDP